MGKTNYLKIPVTVANSRGYLGERFSQVMAWLDLLMLAALAIGGVCLGQVSTSIRALANRWQWGTRTVVTYLQALAENGAIMYEQHNSGRNSRTDITICHYDRYIVCEAEPVFDSDSNPKVPPFAPPGPSSAPLRTSPHLHPSPPISPQEKGSKKHTQSGYACAYVGEGADARGMPMPAVAPSCPNVDTHPPTPFPQPFWLSAEEQTLCAGDPARIVQVKRSHLEANLAVIAPRVGMDEATSQRFLAYWGEPGVAPSDEAKIRAERDGYFDLAVRAERWMRTEKFNTHDSPSVQSVSRVERIIETSINFDKLANEYFKYFSANCGSADDCSADSPDEQ